MQNMVKQIVDMDRKAREITDAAQLEKVQTEKDIVKKREEIRNEYLERARRRIALNEPVERAAAEEAWKKTAEKYQELSRQLDTAGQEKSDEWVQELVSRVIGACSYAVNSFLQRGPCKGSRHVWTAADGAKLQGFACLSFRQRDYCLSEKSHGLQPDSFRHQ